MARRTLLGCLAVATLIIGAGTSCKDKGDGAKTQAGAADLQQRCERVAKACGEQDKHIEKMVVECKPAVATHIEKGCADKAIALYDCYARELCGKADKVWALDDLRVLAERQNKCVAERETVAACAAK